MKILKLAGVVLVSLGLNVVYTGCERHSFENTKVLHEDHHGGHDEGHTEKHDDGHAGGEKKKEHGGGEHKKGEAHAGEKEGAEGGKKVF